MDPKMRTHAVHANPPASRHLCDFAILQPRAYSPSRFLEPVLCRAGEDVRGGRGGEGSPSKSTRTTQAA